MNIRCRHCKSQFNIPDHKLPKDKDAVFTCPKCKEKIQISSAKNPEKESAADAAVPASATGLSFQNRERALILVAEDPFRKAARDAVRKLGYGVDTAFDQAEAAKKIAYHVYPLILLGQGFDRSSKSILQHMNTLDMSIRRMNCLVVMGHQFKTGDPMAALHASANYVVGPDNLEHLASFLAAAVKQHKDFYRVYRDSLKIVGKA